MTNNSTSRSLARKIGAVVAILFGLISIGAGGSVLVGRDPGYMVYLPLLVFNTVMGVVYVGAGVLAWRQSHADRVVAAGIVAVNLVMLAYIEYLYRTGGGAAVDSVRAMVLRTGVWLVLLLVFIWAGRALPKAVSTDGPPSQR